MRVVEEGVKEREEQKNREKPRLLSLAKSFDTVSLTLFSIDAAPLSTTTTTKPSPANRTSPAEARKNVRWAARRVVCEARGGKGRAEVDFAVAAVVPAAATAELSPPRITRSLNTASSTTTRATVNGASDASRFSRASAPLAPRALARAAASLRSAASRSSRAARGLCDLPEASSAGVAPVASRRAREPITLSWAAAAVGAEREGDDEGGGGTEIPAPLPSPHLVPHHQLDAPPPLQRPCSACASSTATSLQPLRAAYFVNAKSPEREKREKKE